MEVESALIKEAPEKSLLPSTVCGHSEKEVQQSATLEEGLHQNLIMLAPWSWISSLQNCEKQNILFISYPVCGMLLQQPK